MASYRILAPAKVNLTLEVTALLPNGFHELDTVFCWLDLADTLTWRPASQASLEMVSAVEGGMEVAAGEDNLVLRALRLLESKTGVALPVAIRLEKHIPAGGGLGGGSSDAAAILYGLNESHKLGLETAQLRAWAAELGADVAFCLLGGTARGLGKGDRLEDLPSPPGRPVVVACPDFGCPTPAIYRQWDVDQPRQRPGASQELVHRLRQGYSWEDLLSNDLQPAAESYRGELAELRRLLLQAGCRYSILSGSGSTVLGFPDEGQVEAVVARMPSRLEEVKLTYRCARLNGQARPHYAGVELL